MKLVLSIMSGLILIPGLLFSADWSPDQFYSTTHTANIKSKDSDFEVKWEATENEDWTGFWYAFSEGEPLTLNDDYEGDYVEISARTLDIWESNWTKSKQISDSGTTSQYFNLSVVDTEGTPHPVTSIGPFFIDTEPPGSPRFTAPETSTTQNIILTEIGATDAEEICVSNSGFGVGCFWEDLESSSKLWTINNILNTETTIYIQFKDDVGNISTASETTTYISSNNNSSTTDTDLVTSIPTINEWGLFVFIISLIQVAIIMIRKKKVHRFRTIQL